ncbi:YjiH family protein [Clostridium sp. AL.422]|uniref:YjiH family protein n=1 Tax=Clostridium TaxID=1485 RepID=UPI00293DAD4A|nr:MULTISPECIES: YjiH family protein [unclassified Clostridium]MDV4152359.1 YjiH family protein [Clostridium sp. AL.422]
MENTTKDKFQLKATLSFIIPSLIGAILFMIPIKFNGEITIPVALMSKFLANILEGSLTSIITMTICISAILSTITKLFKPNFIVKNEFLNTLFNIRPIWLISRILGAVFCVLALFNFGPEMITSSGTGAFVLNDLLTILFTIFFFAGLLLPLLLNFGLLEFFGAILTKVMRPVFTLPGRSSIDCITSWLGDGTLGILLTNKQYEDGFYSKREAAIISTTFSAVSITFSLIVIDTVGLSHLFIPFYLTVTLSGIVAAIILPRIYPLCKLPNTYYNNKEKKDDETIPEGHTSLSWGYNKALDKASQNPGYRVFLIDGIKNVLDMWLGVLPVVMALATIALIIAEYTSVFQILGLPFIPFLNLLQVPEAVAASQTLVVGFADMLLPSVLAANSITSDMTKFIIACTSVSQLIYMSEVGGVLLGSKIPVSLKHLIIIFIERTLITLPVIVLVANIIF